MTSIQEDDSSWVERTPPRQLGGISHALSFAADLGFPVDPHPSQKDLQKLSKEDEFVRILSQLTTVQRKVAELHVELEGRKEDSNVAHLTHASEMEKKIETLARITNILKGVIQNKDRIIGRFQQPYSLDYIPVEAEYQEQFSELLMTAASDYGTLSASMSDLQWTQNFKEPPSVWTEMLRPIPVALSSCTRYFHSMKITRECFSTLQKLRWDPFRLPRNEPSRRTSPIETKSVTPCSSEKEWSSDELDLRTPIMREDEAENLEDEDEDENENETDVDDTNDFTFG